MTEEWRRKLADWASEWLEPGEQVRAAVVCRPRRPPELGEAVGEVLSGLATATGSASGGGGPSRKQPRWCVLMATSKRVLLFPMRDDGLDPPRYNRPLGQAKVRVKRGLLGSSVYLGIVPFDLPPRTRKDALQVALAAS